MTNHDAREAPGRPWWLLGLTIALLTFFTDDYIIAGILPEVAEGLQVSEAAAGQLVTVFSLTMALATPVAAVVFARTSRRVLFPAALAVFVVANLAMAVTTTYAVAVLLRVVSAVAAASAMPAIFAAAADLSPDKERGRYLAVLSMAATAAMAFAVPLGVWIASQLSWHATFVAMAGLGALSLVLVAMTFRGAPTQPPTPLRVQLKILGQRRISLALVGGAVAIMGALTVVTYVAPYLEQTLGRGDMRPLAFLVFGIAATVGTLIGGWVSDSLGPNRTILLGLGAYIAVLLGFSAAWWMRPIGLVVFIPLVVLWGVFTYWSAPAIQVRLHQLAGPYTSQALALNSSLGAVGVAAGAALGGALLAVVPVGALPLAGAALSAVGLVLLWFAFRGLPAPTPEDIAAAEGASIAEDNPITDEKDGR
ncbi:MFS transporter [Corynebacterium sp. TAE3-ERU12]|uniref:MFS transporter n=1 Tax=Corynebacterium sp. TAE3-ERU12 TaxID=2849491 RepID=UPI001C46BF5B|nr:MFS transporter [Corynebacterium sp. TAE3-ERU12]MBV7294667.1 MFS transporter [Corynebacterium sp. TAE3-ERU12]